MLLFSYFTICKQVSLYSLYPAYYKNLNSKWPRANNRKTTVFKKEMFKFYYCIVLWVKTFPFVKNIFFFILLCCITGIILQLPVCYHLHMHSEPGKRFPASSLPFWILRGQYCAGFEKMHEWRKMNSVIFLCFELSHIFSL